MTEKRRKQVIFAILIVAIIWGIYNKPWEHYGASPVPQEATGTPATATGPTPVVTAAVAIGSAPPGARLATEWTVDPFRCDPPKAASKTSVASLEEIAVPVLQGVMKAGDSPVCVIGGNILKPGDRVGQWRVHSITGEKVELERISDGRRVTLSAGGTKAMRGGK